MWAGTGPMHVFGVACVVSVAFERSRSWLTAPQTRPSKRVPQVRSHAVTVLQQKDDDELMYYLLQLVQALRFEASDLSRLARFLVARATSNPAFATFLHWYLFTEWEDPMFGARASCVHAALVDALMGSPRGEAVWEAIRRQTDMVSQLAYIIKDVKVRFARSVDRRPLCARPLPPLCVRLCRADVSVQTLRVDLLSPTRPTDDRWRASRPRARRTGCARCCRPRGRARS